MVYSDAQRDRWVDALYWSCVCDISIHNSFSATGHVCDIALPDSFM